MFGYTIIYLDMKGEMIMLQMQFHLFAEWVEATMINQPITSNVRECPLLSTHPLLLLLSNS